MYLCNILGIFKRLKEVGAHTAMVIIHTVTWMIDFCSFLCPGIPLPHPGIASHGSFTVSSYICTRFTIIPLWNMHVVISIVEDLATCT